MGVAPGIGFVSALFAGDIGTTPLGFALTNLVGNGVATIVVGKWCDGLNSQKLRAHLNNETYIDANEPEEELIAVEEGGMPKPAAIKRTT